MRPRKPKRDLAGRPPVVSTFRAQKNRHAQRRARGTRVHIDGFPAENAERVQTICDSQRMSVQAAVGSFDFRDLDPDTVAGAYHRRRLLEFRALLYSSVYDPQPLLGCLRRWLASVPTGGGTLESVEDRLARLPRVLFNVLRRAVRFDAEMAGRRALELLHTNTLVEARDGPEQVEAAAYDRDVLVMCAFAQACWGFSPRKADAFLRFVASKTSEPVLGCRELWESLQWRDATPLADKAAAAAADMRDPDVPMWAHGLNDRLVAPELIHEIKLGLSLICLRLDL